MTKGFDTSAGHKPMGELAAITGAAGGLGKAFARELAARGFDLLLVDRDADGLARVAIDLRRENRVGIETLTLDLTDQIAIGQLEKTLEDSEHLTILVNNAGFGTYSMFHDADITRQVQMVNLHVIASMRLCRASLPAMKARKRGAVVNVASAAAFLRFPRDATYIGTKSFLVAFTECLAIELVDTGVALQALCPAWVRTDFHAGGDYDKADYRSPMPAWLYSDADTVVRSSLRDLAIRSGTHIPTLRGRVAVLVLGSRIGLWTLAIIRRTRRARSGRRSKPADQASRRRR